MQTALIVGLVIIGLIAIPIVAAFNMLIARRAAAHNRWVALDRALHARQAQCTRIIELMRDWPDANDLILRLEQGMTESLAAPSPAHAAHADRRLSVSIRAVGVEAQRLSVDHDRWRTAWAQMCHYDQRVARAQAEYEAAADRFNDLVLRRPVTLLALAMGMRSVEPYQDGPDVVALPRLREGETSGKTIPGD